MMHGDVDGDDYDDDKDHHDCFGCGDDVDRD